MKIALQMDPIAGIDIGGDSSFLLGLGAQERGHTLFYYTPRDLRWQNADGTARLTASARPVRLRNVKDAHADLGPVFEAQLDEAFDVILLRQDPPFHMGYLTTTYLLERIAHKVRILNDPKAVRDAPEKILVTHFAHLMPPTRITSSPDEIAGFAQTHGRVVAKKLYGHGGREVFLFAHDDPALPALAAAHWQATGEPLMLQAYLPEVEAGDMRVILFNGQAVAAMRRVPKKGAFLANLAQGGTAEICDIDAPARAICEAVGPTLRELGLYFAGLDIIGGHLIEINVTSPTGLPAINRLYGLTGDARMEMRFWQGLGL